MSSDIYQVQLPEQVPPKGCRQEYIHKFMGCDLHPRPNQISDFISADDMFLLPVIKINNLNFIALWILRQVRPISECTEVEKEEKGETIQDDKCRHKTRNERNNATDLNPSYLSYLALWLSHYPTVRNTGFCTQAFYLCHLKVIFASIWME